MMWDEENSWALFQLICSNKERLTELLRPMLKDSPRSLAMLPRHTAIQDLLLKYLDEPNLQPSEVMAISVYIGFNYPTNNNRRIFESHQEKLLLSVGFYDDLRHEIMNLLEVFEKDKSGKVLSELNEDREPGIMGDVTHALYEQVVNNGRSKQSIVS